MLYDAKGNYIRKGQIIPSSTKVWARQLFSEIRTKSCWDHFLFITLFDQFSRPLSKVENQREDSIIKILGGEHNADDNTTRSRI
jgi:hypothetical protein